MTISFTGLNSVMDRILFTDRGPVVKRPVDVLTGSNLQILTETDVFVPTGSFVESTVGQLLEIVGSAGGRNDGSFYVKQVLGSTRLRLEDASFDITNVAATTAQVVGLANDLKSKYNSHRSRKISQGSSTVGVHGTDDTVHVVTASIASDLGTAIVLLNDIRTQFDLHVVDVSGDPKVHLTEDGDSLLSSPVADSLASAVVLANEIRKKFEFHRQNRKPHQIADPVDRIVVQTVKPVVGTYPSPLTGPLTWTLKETSPGLVADSPSDVDVVVNGSPAAVDAVFGLLGAVVLSVKPDPSDTVSVDYAYLKDPPARLLRLNSPEFSLNQDGNRPYAGFPDHRYRSRSFLIQPGHSPDFMSAVRPKKVGWKYKGYERRYTAALNDPTTLLLNVPTNRIMYPVLSKTVLETTLRYDPTSLPQDASDPWILEGDGTFSLAPGGNELTIVDSNVQTGSSSKPPFFTHQIDLIAPSILSAAFRMRVEESVNDGVFTGVSFGISDGQKVAVIGFVLTDAMNLSSGISMANAAKAEFNAHLVNLGSHEPDDTVDSVIIVDATGLSSLIILVNEMKSKVNLHVAKGGAEGVHIVADAVNPIVSPDADDLLSALLLVNEIRNKFNSHRVQPGIHFLDDFENVVDQVRQAGILTNRGFSEFQESWNCASVDWTVLKTYRIFRTDAGDVSLYLSGGSSPIASVLSMELPSISDLDGKFDPVQQIFFGPIGRESTSVSQWAFVRANLSPLDANLVGDNKRVDYESDTVPELDPDAPWITIGQGGTERVQSGILTVDSTASAPSSNFAALGLSSGAHRGFVRIEPVLSVDTTCSFEFAASADFWTHSLDNRSACVLIDDENFSVQLCFLQFSPSPAIVRGSATEPYPMISGDQMVLSLDEGAETTVLFTPADSTAANVAATVNAVFGFPLASAVSGRVVFTSATSGIQASIRIISGSALSKLGFSPGLYRGKDSNPEPRVSWFGADFPDLDSPTWTRSGSQKSEMFSRTMRLTDSSASDYVTFTLGDPTVTNQAFGPLTDWKMDCRFAVLSFVPGDVVPVPGPPYVLMQFCGALVSVDEGPGGKSVELQTAMDGSTGIAYLNLVSFNPATGALDVRAQYAFNWNDGLVHSYDIYTSKVADAMFVLADGILLTPLPGQLAPTYSGLNSGFSGPSLSFGSGSGPVVGSDMRVAGSVVDWSSVTVFRDSKISDPTAASRRYVGIFGGGDPTLLGSYYLHQIDWSSLHTYRIVRDPTSSVSVFVDGGLVPVISTNYDSLRLPPSSSSFLKGITNGHSTVAFASFNPQEIVRTRWDFIRYSIGRLTFTDRLVPYGEVLNRANAVASPDHLFTSAPHSHAGMQVYSGGTPLDEFLSDAGVLSHTVLMEGTPPVPMTQDLESRGGLEKTVTTVESVPSVDLVNVNAFLSDLEDDTYDVIQEPPAVLESDAVAGIVALANDIQSKYNFHLTSPGTHSLNDGVNGSVLPPASDLTTAIALLNELKAKFDSHRTQPGVHDFDDTIDAVSASDAVDMESAIVLGNDLRQKYADHRSGGKLHVSDDAVNSVLSPDATDLSSLAVLAEDIRVKLSSHVQSVIFHIDEDPKDVVGARAAGIGTGSVQLDLITVSGPVFPLAPGNTVRFLTGPNAGVDRIVATAGAGSFTVTVPYGFPDSSPSLYSRVSGGQPVVDLSSLASTVNELKSRYNSHRLRTVPAASTPIHRVLDIRYVTSSPDSWSLVTASDLANELKADYNSHRTGHTFHFNNTPALSAPSVGDPLSTAVLLASDVVDVYNLHLVRPRVHLTDDQRDFVLLPPPVDEPGLVAVANELKVKFNRHRTAVRVHTSDDLANAVSSPDATDLASAIVLLNDIRFKYEAHRVQPGVHGASVMIRLDPPDRVLYEGMKFFQFPEGEEGHVSPFSDEAVGTMYDTVSMITTTFFV